MISIVVPVYNTKTSVSKCVNSLVHQTYTDTEIILVDDGSDFGTASICDLLMKEYDNVVVYHCENRGVSAARNYGIQKASGKYIFFADSDDYAEPRMLEVMVEKAERYQSQLVIAGYYFDIVCTNKNKHYVECIKQKMSSINIETKDELKNEMVTLWDSSLMYNIWNKLFQLEIIKNNQIYFPLGKEFNEDRDFVREYMYHVQTAFVIEDCFYHYIRENDVGATGIYRLDMLEIRKEEFRNLCSFFKKMGVYNAQSREYISREHFDRVVGTVENIFHSNMSGREVRCEISKILNDNDTKYVMKYAKPKSKKMKILYMIFKTRNVGIIYTIIKIIYLIKRVNPALFYRLRQSR